MRCNSKTLMKKLQQEQIARFKSIQLSLFSYKLIIQWFILIVCLITNVFEIFIKVNSLIHLKTKGPVILEITKIQ